MKKSEKISIKKDAFRIARGGRSLLIDLFCDSCGEFIALYQKDGPGPLKRMYLDRILGPDHFASLLFKVNSIKKVPDFFCPQCQEPFGIPMVYKKENRLAYKLFQSVLKKKKHLNLR